MATYKELCAQIESLKAQADAQRKAEIAAVVADIRAKMDEFGLTQADIFPMRGRRTSGQQGAVAPKYRHPVTGETWSGRGKMPRWLDAEVQGGKSKADFLISA